MSKRSLVLAFLFGALLTSGAVMTSRAASANPETTEQPAGQSCSETICHTTIDCSLGTTSCGVCVIPDGAFFGHCVLKK